VEALDKDGRPVPTADHLIGFRISGSGALIGVGNGDPNCQESDKEAKRSLYNGLAQAIVQAGKQPGEIHVEAVSEKQDQPKLASAQLVLVAKKVQLRPAAS